MHSQRGTLLPIIQIQLIGKPAITVVRAAVSSSSQLSTAAAAAKSLQSCLTLCDPTRLPRPWDSAGKNTGVGCHFLLQCMKVKSESEVPQLCLTPSDPMDCSLPGSFIHGIFQARVLEWVAIAFAEGHHYHLLKFHIYALVSQRRQWHPTPVLLPGKSHGRRSLVGCNPWGR